MKTKMKWVALLAAACSLLIAAVLVVGAAAAPDPFKGKWHSVDLADGSNQTLQVGGGPGSAYHVRYYDDGASVCVPHPLPPGSLYAASAVGELTALGNTLSGVLPVYCLASPRYLYESFSFSFTYDPVTDKLTDGWSGGVWVH